MIDIHNHLLYGIDDGSKTLEQSVDILNDMYNYGYTDIILTPHYIKDSQYTSSKKDNLKLLNTLQNAIKEKGININLYLGNEIYIDESITDLYKKGEVTTLNDSNCFLIELPMSGFHSEYKDIFSYLMSKGYVVILAHPERYLSFQKDFNKVYELREMGVLFQSNIDSMIGSYGKSAEKMLKKLLKENVISFLATDIHHKKHDYGKWDKAKKQICKIIGEERYNELTYKNPKKLIN